MSRVALPARLLLGLVFTVFSLDGVLHVVPLPALPQPALDFLGVLITVRLFYAVKLLELTCGLMLLHGRFTTLAALLLTPILFNIVWFDAMLDPASLPVALVLAVLDAALLWAARDQLAPLLKAAPIREAAHA